MLRELSNPGIDKAHDRFALSDVQDRGCESVLVALLNQPEHTLNSQEMRNLTELEAPDWMVVVRELVRRTRIIEPQKDTSQKAGERDYLFTLSHQTLLAVADHSPRPDYLTQEIIRVTQEQTASNVGEVALRQPATQCD